MNNLSYKLKINPNIRIILVPIVVISFVILLLIIFVPKAIPEINKRLDEYKKSQSEVKALDEKLNSLKKISPNLLDPEDVTVIAMPSKNPVVWVVSHIKKAAKENDVQLGKIEMDKEKDSDDIKSSSVSFEFKAKDYMNLLTFMSEMTKILPVNSLGGIMFERKDERDGNVYSGDMNTAFYWSDFPITLPPINHPIDELTNEDLNLIGVVSKYKKPSFIELQPKEAQGRPQPFN